MQRGKGSPKLSVANRAAQPASPSGAGPEPPRGAVELGFAVSDASVGRIVGDLIRRGRVPAAPDLLRKVGGPRLAADPTAPLPE